MSELLPMQGPYYIAPFVCSEALERVQCLRDAGVCSAKCWFMAGIGHYDNPTQSEDEGIGYANLLAKLDMVESASAAATAF